MRENRRPFNQRLGQVLVTLDVISHAQVFKARRIQIVQKPSEPIGQILIDLGYITTDDLSRALGIQRDLEQV